MYRAGDSYYKIFTTRLLIGGESDADSLPTASVIKNGSIDGDWTPTVAKIDTGRYKITGKIGRAHV